MRTSKRRRLILFPITTLVALCFVIGVTFLSYRMLMEHDASDRKTFLRLMNANTVEKDTSTASTSIQHHRNTNKEIWFTRGQQRLQLVLIVKTHSL